MKLVAARLFFDALLGLQFLHSHNWIHGDIKPANIGITGFESRAVLLDLGSAIRADPKSLIPPTPGKGGTVPFLAPEREMEGYNRSIDTWAMGVVGFQLTYGAHPWELAVNPWCPGHQNRRSTFNLKYEKAITLMSQQHPQTATSHSPQYIQGMLAFFLSSIFFFFHAFLQPPVVCLRNLTT